MGSDSATAVASQQSVKAYVDGKLSTIGYKASDTTKTSDDTLADDADLQATLDASSNYIVE